MEPKGPSRLQALALQAIVPILLIGVVLPIGLVALLLLIDGASLSGAVDHGELFLAGGNAAFIACLLLMSARPDRAMGVFVVCQLAFVLVVLPSYAAWAHVTALSAQHDDYSEAMTVQGGLVATAAGLIVAIICVVYSFWSPKRSRRSSAAH